MANYFSPNRGTHYDTTHNFKEQQQIQQWPHPEHKLIIIDGKFSTEVRDNYHDFNDHELNG